jgi:hypothetical protein
MYGWKTNVQNIKTSDELFNEIRTLWETWLWTRCGNFIRSLFVPLSCFFWPLCCRFFFDLRILITPLVSLTLLPHYQSHRISRKDSYFFMFYFKFYCYAGSSKCVRPFWNVLIWLARLWTFKRFACFFTHLCLVSEVFVAEEINLSILFTPWYRWNTVKVGVKQQSISQPTFKRHIAFMACKYVVTSISKR